MAEEPGHGARATRELPARRAARRLLVLLVGAGAVVALGAGRAHAGDGPGTLRDQVVHASGQVAAGRADVSSRALRPPPPRPTGNSRPGAMAAAVTRTARLVQPRTARPPAPAARRIRPSSAEPVPAGSVLGDLVGRVATALPIPAVAGAATAALVPIALGPPAPRAAILTSARAAVVPAAGDRALGSPAPLVPRLVFSVRVGAGPDGTAVPAGGARPDSRSRPAPVPPARTLPGPSVTLTAAPPPLAAAGMVTAALLGVALARGRRAGDLAAALRDRATLPLIFPA